MLKDKYSYRTYTIGPNKLFVEAFYPSTVAAREPILCIPGAFDGSWIFSRIAPIMAALGWPVFSMNPRGYYKSIFNDVANLSIRDYLEDVSIVRKELKLENTIILGYSVGGLLAQLSAEKGGAKALLLYDPSPAREIAMLAKIPPTKDFTDSRGNLPKVIQFIPSKAIVEEMWGRRVSDKEYQEQLNLFKQTFLSGKAFREMEIERPEIKKADCPALILGIDPNNVVHKIMYRELEMSWYAFEGYSHGSLLINPKADRITRMVLSWLASGCPTGIMKHFKTIAFDPVLQRSAIGRKKYFSSKQNQQSYLVLQKESVLTHLKYFSGWSKPIISVVEEKKNYDFMMKISGKGRIQDEKLFKSTFEMNSKRGFFIKGESGEDHPSYGMCYKPALKELWLRDGIFYSYNPPIDEIKPQFVHLTVPCPELSHEFRVTVKLPRNYDNSNTYPIAFLNDGQNQWTNKGAMNGWHTDSIAEMLVKRGSLTEIILVGINCHRFRNKAYLPPPFGRADLYIDWVANKLLPLLREKWNISADPYHIAMIGSSYGANVSVYAGLRRGDIFGLIGALSFAYIRGNPQLKEIEALHKRPFRRAYIDCGTRWAPDQPHRDDYTLITLKLLKICRERWMTDGKDLFGYIADGHFHQEIFWRKRIGQCLKFLFR